MEKKSDLKEIKKNILVLAAKDIGFQLLKYLLSIKAPVDFVIVGNRQDKDILELIKKHKIEFEIYKNSLQSQFIQSGHHYEWMLNLWSPYILKPGFLNLAKQHLNVHPGLLPQCRGNDCAAWIIRKGLPAGVALLEMDANVDSGNIFIQKPINYSFPIRGVELHHLLKSELIKLFKDSWLDIYNGKIQPHPQEGQEMVHKRADTEKDRRLDLNETMSTCDFVQRILAHDFYPNTTAEIHHQGKKYKIRLELEEIKDK